jgi:Protein of unknown function (DUF3052)
VSHMADRDYSHRAVVDKLGVKPGHAVVFDERAGALDDELREQVLERAGRAVAEEGESVDVVLATVDAETDAAAALRHWRPRIQPAGGIWLLTPKRGLPGHVDQRELIPAGQEAGVVDNKTCSVSDSTSAMRFVIRKRDRPAAG